MTEKWDFKAAVGRVATAKGVDKLSCTYETMSWMIDRGASIDIAIPGTRVGDIPSGEELIGSWKGKRIVASDEPNVLSVYRLDGTRAHVRVKSGELHEGAPKDCYEASCLAETVMGS